MRNVWVQQGPGSSPGLCAPLVERLLWPQWGAAAAEHEWSAQAQGCRTCSSWADDSLVTASSFSMLRCVLRRNDHLLE